MGREQPDGGNASGGRATGKAAGQGDTLAALTDLAGFAAGMLDFAPPTGLAGGAFTETAPLAAIFEAPAAGPAAELPAGMASAAIAVIQAEAAKRRLLMLPPKGPRSRSRDEQDNPKHSGDWQPISAKIGL